jgi:hypothetical protein
LLYTINSGLHLVEGHIVIVIEEGYGPPSNNNCEDNICGSHFWLLGDENNGWMERR